MFYITLLTNLNYLLFKIINTDIVNDCTTLIMGAMRKIIVTESEDSSNKASELPNSIN